jgi:hypothetical protein
MPRASVETPVEVAAMEKRVVGGPPARANTPMYTLQGREERGQRVAMRASLGSMRTLAGVPAGARAFQR